MRGDFSRLTFDRAEHGKKHYAAVLHQQGRVWLDADWNEDVLARLRLLQQETLDIIGDCGTPDNPGTGFKISPSDKDPADFIIDGGRYYVHGILAELEERTYFSDQPDLPQAKLSLSPDTLQAGEDQFAVIYLEVWRRLITYLEDDKLREVALGGPDTATRLKTVAQVKIAPVPDGSDCKTALPDDGHGTLSTEFETRTPSTVDPCRLPDDVDYTGRENRLYRVEIHEPGELLDAPQFVSRISLSEDAAAGVQKLVLSRPLADNELTALKRSGNVTLCDNAPQTEFALIDSVDADKKVVNLKRGLKRAFTTAANAFVRVNTPRVVLAQDAPAGATTLTLKEPLEGARKRSGTLIVSDDSGRSEIVQFATVDGKELLLTAGLKNAFEKDHDAAVTVIAQFKWSRDNAAFAAGVSEVDDDRLELTLTSLGRDQATVLRAGDVVEISDDVHELGFNRGFLTTLTANPDPDEFTVKLAKALPEDFAIDKHLILRRWDGVGVASAKFDSDKTPDMDLGDGIRINFGGYDLRAGDYWTFAARSNDGTVEPLKDEPPTGIHRQRCPLALGHWTKGGELNQSAILWVLGNGDNKLTPDQLEQVKKQFGTDLDKVFDKESIKDFAIKGGATEAQIAAFADAIDSVVHFHIDHDCRKKFTPLNALPWLYMRYIGGDGQESNPDGTLEQDLQVAVYRGGKPQKDVIVRFHTKEGGTLNGQKDAVTVKTLEDGIATCKWKLNLDGPGGNPYPHRVQRVEATLVDTANSDSPIRFNASLGLCSLNYVGGDGQEANPDGSLAQKLEVAVYQGGRPVKDAKVKFTTNDGGTLDTNPPGGESTTDANGIAVCTWTLNPDAQGGKPFPTRVQLAEAALVNAPNNDSPIRFNASLSLRRLSYVSGDGQVVSGPDQKFRPFQVAVFNGYEPVNNAEVRFEAIDGAKGKLTGKDVGGNDVTGMKIDVGTRDGIAECIWEFEDPNTEQSQVVEARLLNAKQTPIEHPIRFVVRDVSQSVFKIKGVKFTGSGNPLINSQRVRAFQFEKGIDLVLNEELEKLQIDPRGATCFVSAEIPGVFLNERIAGAQLPLVLDGVVSLPEPNRIHWDPSRNAIALLKTLEENHPGILLRLTLLGNLIWDEKSNRHLDGESFSTDDKPSLIGMPSGDGRRGGDFRMWFRLDRSNLRLANQTVDFGAAVHNQGRVPKEINVSSPVAQTVKFTIIDPTDTFTVTPAQQAIQAGEELKVTVVFAPKLVQQKIEAILRIEGDTDVDIQEIKLSGEGT